MSTPLKSQQLVVMPDDGEHYLTMPQDDFVDLYCQPIMDDTWIRQHDIVHMSDLVETEGGEKIKQEILHEHIQERAKAGHHRQDPILEGMLWQEQFMDDYQHSGERTQDSEQALSYRARILQQYRSRNPNRRASNAEAIEAVLSPSKRAANAVTGSAAGSPRYPTSAADTVDAAAAPEKEESDAAAPTDANRCPSPEELSKGDLVPEKDTAAVPGEHAAPDGEDDLNHPQYDELHTPTGSKPTSPLATEEPVGEPNADATGQEELEAVDVDEKCAAGTSATNADEVADIPAPVADVYPTEQADDNADVFEEL